MATEKPKSELALAREGTVGRIDINGVIGWEFWGEGMSYQTFKEQLAALGDMNLIEVFIHSPGGIISDGNAMINALREHGATIHTYNMGEAASMGSVLLLAGDRIFIPDNSMTFIHKPLTCACGNADDMREIADSLDKFEKAITASYKKQFKGTDSELEALVNQEAWWNAEEIGDKFNNVTVVHTGEAKVAATSDPVAILGDLEMPQESMFDKMVNKVRSTVNKVETEEVSMPMTPEERQAIVDEVTTSVVAALKPAPVAPVEDPEPVAKIDIAFEGDMEDPTAVKAHLQKVQIAQLQASTDFNDPVSVSDYHDALNKAKGVVPTPIVPASNTVSQRGVLGSEDTSYSPEDLDAAVNRLSK